MHIGIGAAILLVALIWFAIVYPGFRKFPISAVVGIGVVLFLLIMNAQQREERQAAFQREVNQIVLDACPNLGTRTHAWKRQNSCAEHTQTLTA
jgi:hypothetical protein